jgi:hypothetical protein
MDVGKAKIVLNALREELHARRAAGAQRTAGSADDAAIRPVSSTGDAHLNHEERNANKERRRAQRTATRAGVLVHLSDTALGAADSSASPMALERNPAVERGSHPIPDVVVPFRVSDEPLVRISPNLVIALLVAAAAGVVILVVL